MSLPAWSGWLVGSVFLVGSLGRLVHGPRFSFESRRLWMSVRRTSWTQTLTYRICGTQDRSWAEHAGSGGADALVEDDPESVGVGQCRPDTCLLYTSPSPRDRQKSRM